MSRPIRFLPFKIGLSPLKMLFTFHRKHFENDSTWNDLKEDEGNTKLKIVLKVYRLSPKDIPFLYTE